VAHLRESLAAGDLVQDAEPLATLAADRAPRGLDYSEISTGSAGGPPAR
jgi:hypothetical protein